MNPRIWLMEAYVEFVGAAPRTRCARPPAQPSSSRRRWTSARGPPLRLGRRHPLRLRGRKERALAEYALLLRDPGAILGVQSRRLDAFSKLRERIRASKALVNDPANNAPLF